MNLMTRGNQTRHQLLSDRSRRTSHEHSHQRLLERGIIYTQYDEMAPPAVTPASTPARDAATPPHAAGLQRRRAPPRRGDRPLDRRRLPEPVKRQSHNPERLEFLVRGGVPRGAWGALHVCRAIAASRQVPTGPDGRPCYARTRQRDDCPSCVPTGDARESSARWCATVPSQAEMSQRATLSRLKTRH